MQNAAHCAAFFAIMLWRELVAVSAFRKYANSTDTSKNNPTASLIARLIGW